MKKSYRITACFLSLMLGVGILTANQFAAADEPATDSTTTTTTTTTQDGSTTTAATDATTVSTTIPTVQQLQADSQSLQQQADTMLRADHNPSTHDYYYASKLYRDAAFKLEYAQRLTATAPPPEIVDVAGMTDDQRQSFYAIHKLYFAADGARRMASERQMQGLP